MGVGDILLLAILLLGPLIAGWLIGDIIATALNYQDFRRSCALNRLKCPNCYGVSVLTADTQLWCFMCGWMQKRVGRPWRGFYVRRRSG